jgi:hypothetical protein
VLGIAPGDECLGAALGVCVDFDQTRPPEEGDWAGYERK